jgi:hypothetical protein
MLRGSHLALSTGRGIRRVGFDPAEPMLIPHRMSGRFPPPNGADIAFFGLTAEGGFYCKEDKDGRPIRATEMLCTRIAGHSGVLTPHCAVVEDDEGETYFGSLALLSPAGIFEVRSALITPATSEIGSPDPWLGSYLSSLYALDLAVGNPDRSMTNFLMDASDRQLRAFDFASADLKKLATDRILIEGTRTLSVGRVLRSKHGFDLDAALEMVKRLEATPVKTIRRFLGELPNGWLTQREGDVLCDDWENRLGARLAALSAGLRDGSLL